MRAAVAALLLACGSSPPPTTPTPRDATNPAEPPTSEQCEQVLAHLAEISIVGEPDDAPETVDAKKKTFIDRSRKQGFIPMCTQGSRAVADCKIQAADLESQAQCSQ